MLTERAAGVRGPFDICGSGVDWDGGILILGYVIIILLFLFTRLDLPMYVYHSELWLAFLLLSSSSSSCYIGSCAEMKVTARACFPF